MNLLAPMELFVMPFDHRGSFEEGLLGIVGRAPTPTEAEEIRACKRLVYEGFKLAVASGVPRQSTAVLVDEKYGFEILRQAREDGFRIACPVEKSGQAEFQFEHGENGFAEELRSLSPDFAKALVRYNPMGDSELNSRQAERLRALSDFCRDSRTRLMLEVVVPPTASQLAWLAGDRARFETELRPELMIQAIRQLHESGVEPALWKLEGVESRDAAAWIAGEARTEGRAAGVILLGRGESAETVRRWLTIAAGVPGYVGFAIGRTVFWDALVGLRRGAIDRAEAARVIARRFSELCRLWQEAELGGARRAEAGL